MTDHTVGSREEWDAAREELLAREKELTRLGDELARKRRELPWVPVEKEYRFESGEGTKSLAELFDGRSQLLVYHFMFGPSYEAGCPTCSSSADSVNGVLPHLKARDVTTVYVSRAPLEKLEAYKAKRGWSFPWVSSYGSDFNYDFGVTLDASVGALEYNYRAVDAGDEGEQPGQSCFLREGERVFHTYSSYARGAEMTGGSYYYLDLTALGRQEDWEEPKGRAGAHGAVPDFSG
jgi:predicted dithiol-disulfide oxidoreductase (DUF899 family)